MSTPQMPPPPSGNPNRPPGKKPEKKTSGWTIALIVGAVGCLPALAIFGILAAIAIPNFLKFQCKSQQSEAKMEMSGLFTSEKMFWGENQTYTTDLVALQWAPNGNPTYLYGYANPDTNPPVTLLSGGSTNPDRRHTAHPDVISNGGYGTSQMTDTNGNPLDPTRLPAGTTATDSQFLAGAIGDFSAANADYDTWTINETRMLQATVDECH